MIQALLVQQFDRKNYFYFSYLVAFFCYFSYNKERMKKQGMD